MRASQCLRERCTQRKKLSHALTTYFGPLPTHPPLIHAAVAPDAFDVAVSTEMDRRRNRRATWHPSLMIQRRHHECHHARYARQADRTATHNCRACPVADPKKGWDETTPHKKALLAKQKEERPPTGWQTFDSSYLGALQKARRRNHAPGLTKALSSPRASLSSISLPFSVPRTNKKKQEGQISSPVPPVHTPSEGGVRPPPSDPCCFCYATISLCRR